MDRTLFPLHLFICFTTPQSQFCASVQDSLHSACASVWFGRRYLKMDWNCNNDSVNFTNHFECCETILGTIVTWNLTIYLSTIVIAATANVLLLFAIYKNPLKCFRNPTSYFIANLAIADLLSSLFHFEEVLISQTTYRSTFCLPGAWGTINSEILRFFYLLNFPSVAVLALERYVSIAYPLWHQVKVTTRLCYICIAVVWLINGIFTSIVSVGTTTQTELRTAYPSVFYLTTVFIYLLAYISIRRQRFSLSTDITNSDTVKRMMKLRLRNQNRFLTTVFIINVLLIFGIIPSVITTHFMYSSEGTVSTSVEMFFIIALILFFLNLAANPFLYIWRLPKYRRTFLVMYCCKK